MACVRLLTFRHHHRNRLDSTRLLGRGREGGNICAKHTIRLNNASIYRSVANANKHPPRGWRWDSQSNGCVLLWPSWWWWCCRRGQKHKIFGECKKIMAATAAVWKRKTTNYSKIDCESKTSLCGANGHRRRVLQYSTDALGLPASLPGSIVTECCSFASCHSHILLSPECGGINKNLPLLAVLIRCGDEKSAN